MGGKLQMHLAEQLSRGKMGNPAREWGQTPHSQGTLSWELLSRAFPCRSGDFSLSASSARALQGEWEPSFLMIWTPISYKTPRTRKNSPLRNGPATCSAKSGQQRNLMPPLRPTPASSRAQGQTVALLAGSQRENTDIFRARI